MAAGHGRFALFDEDNYTTAVHKVEHNPTARSANGSDAGKVGTASREIPADAGFVH